MTRNVSAVIGANWGDEGKGLVTDYLSQTPNSVVVRFNGGAQAGHTVTTPDGRRHVFQHFGSGSFGNAVTFLSPYFVVNPIAFVSEFNELQAIGVTPSVYIDPRCAVTTPYDVMLNHAVEAKRGDGRHGSCGMGINETVTRHADPMFRFVATELRAPREKLLLIRDVYVRRRAAALDVSLDTMPFLFSNDVLEKFVTDCERTHFFSVFSSWELFAPATERNIIFEGAQGLRLDQDHRDFPHVTRSKTGLANVVSLMSAAGCKEKLDVYYVTRPYLTRHGAGPLPGEVDGLPYPGIVDRTNVPNAHQGTLRFGLLNTDDLAAEVAADLVHAQGMEVRHHLVMTCVNQLGECQLVRCVDADGKESVATLGAILDALKQRAGFDKVLVSNGPTRESVRANSAAVEHPGDWLTAQLCRIAEDVVEKRLASLTLQGVDCGGKWLDHPGFRVKTKFDY